MTTLAFEKELEGDLIGDGYARIFITPESDHPIQVFMPYLGKTLKLSPGDARTLAAALLEAANAAGDDA